MDVSAHFAPASVEQRVARALHDALAQARHPLEPGILAVLTVASHAGAASGPGSADRAPLAMAPHRLRRVETWVAANLPGRISLEDMARVAGLSRFHFARCFARDKGMTPAAYVRQQRVAYAARLMTATDLRLAEIALVSGFASQAHLTHAFRRMTGVPPARWRAGAAALAADLVPGTEACGAAPDGQAKPHPLEEAHGLGAAAPERGLALAQAAGRLGLQPAPRPSSRPPSPRAIPGR